MNTLNFRTSLLLLALIVSVVVSAKPPKHPNKQLVSDHDGKDKQSAGQVAGVAKRAAEANNDPTPVNDDDDFDIDAIVDKINKDNSHGFKAKSYDQFKGKKNKHLKNFLGLDVNKEKEHHAKRSKRQTFVYPPNFSSITYPNQFDVTTKWPQCNIFINDIQNQGNCGSCYAVASAAVITDRRCITWNTTNLYRRSAWDIVSCCPDCAGTAGNGCSGGSRYAVFNYYSNYGVVSGGDYTTLGSSTAYCKPYPYTPSQTAPSTTPCDSTCQSGFTQRTYSDDLRYGDNYYSITYGDNAVKWELMNNGPVAAGMAVYQDFYSYSSGVYKHVSGNLVGYHAVKLVGWGVDSSGQKYWRIANSWGPNWGESGFFRIRRETNECQIESRDAAAATVWD